MQIQVYRRLYVWHAWSNSGTSLIVQLCRVNFSAAVSSATAHRVHAESAARLARESSHAPERSLVYSASCPTGPVIGSPWQLPASNGPWLHGCWIVWRSAMHAWRRQDQYRSQDLLWYWYWYTDSLIRDHWDW